MPNKNNAPPPIPACHPDRKHLARGFCKPCYDADYADRNRVAINAKSAAWQKNNPERRRANHRKYRYGIDAETVQARLRAQDGMCKICGCKPATDLDHNHKTGQVRSLLCGDCNRGLGLFRENPDVLRSAVAYLAVWESMVPQVQYNTGKRMDGAPDPHWTP